MVSREYLMIKKGRESGNKLDVRVLSRGITQEVKFEKSFTRAEELFQYLLQELKRRKEEDKCYADSDIIAFQHTVATLIRYATNPQKSLDYGYFVLNAFEPPLRSKELQLRILTNIIYRFGENRRIEKNMNVALQLIKLAISLDVFHADIASSEEKTLLVFNDVANKVLQHYKLRFSEDKKTIESA